MGTSATFTIEPVVGEKQLRAYNELANRLRPYFAETWDEFQHGLQWVDDSDRLLLLAWVDGKAVGKATVENSPYLPDSEFAQGSVLVDEPYQQHGIGTALYERVSEWARDHGFKGLRLHQIETDTAGAKYWGKRGFTEVERYIDVALELATFEVPPITPPDGVRIVALADEPHLLSEFYDILVEVMPDIPSEGRVEMPPFDKWARLAQQSPAWRPDSTFLAVEIGEDGREHAIGIGELEFQLARPDILWHGFTAVRRTHRRRGIARVLKYTTIARAKELGVRLLQTENEERNAPMRTLNIELGYKPLPVRMTLHGPLAGD